MPSLSPPARPASSAASCTTSPIPSKIPKDMIIFVGWIPYGNPGPQIAGRRSSWVRIFDRFYDVKCQIRTIHGLSAHADGDELLRFLTPTLKKETTA